MIILSVYNLNHVIYLLHLPEELIELAHVQLHLQLRHLPSLIFQGELYFDEAL